MRHLFLPLAAASALVAISVAPASAHPTLERAEAAPGGYKAVIRIPHGCAGQPTHTVRVEVPEGYVGVKPMPKPGWSLAIESGDYARTYQLHGRDVSSGTKAVTWSGGVLEDSHYDEFVLSGSLSGVEAGQALYFNTTQLCADGEVAWNEIPMEGRNPHELERPAPRLMILAANDEDGHGGHAAHGGMADAVVAGDIEITGAWARAMLPNQPAGGGYLTITNTAAEADRLIGTSSPVAGKVEVHAMEMVDDVMTMRPVEGGLEIPGDAAVKLEPGGLHLMFMMVSDTFDEGESVPVSLEFERAGSVQVELPVGPRQGAESGHSDH